VILYGILHKFFQFLVQCNNDELASRVMKY